MTTTSAPFLTAKKISTGPEYEYTVQGDYTSVELYIKDKLERYPPCAYGTQILTDHYGGNVRTVRMTRYHSCD
jgi:hypothetical protein